MGQIGFFWGCEATADEPPDVWLTALQAKTLPLDALFPVWCWWASKASCIPRSCFLLPGMIAISVWPLRS